ncbi:MAG: response regulator transcription factor [Spirochaetia bacterium]|jgi:DNA-binding NarL/FixJ family response regulator
MIRVLIADDHGIVRQGLKQIVSESPGIVVTGEAADGEEALALARQQQFDVAIIDIAMPRKGGLDILKELRREHPLMKLIVLSIYSEEQYAIRCLRDGASAYLSKGNATDELIPAIQTVAAGKRFITPLVAERLASYVEGGEKRALHEGLSNREMQIFLLIGGGKSASDISRELSLSVKTISTYRARILLKMGMQTNAQLIQYAIRNGLVP